jgi:hypothetical protein
VVPARTDAPWRARRGVRRTVVRRAREQLREQDRVDDVPCRLGVRAAASLGAQGDQEEGAEVVRHGHIVAGGEDGRVPD